MHTQDKKAFVIIVLIALLFLAGSVGCDPDEKVQEAKDGFQQLQQLVDSKTCLEETLGTGSSDACPGAADSH